jgi:adenylate kinase
LGKEYKQKMNDLKEKMREEAEALEKKNKPKKVANKKDVIPEPVVEKVFNPRIPEDLVNKILKRRLNENDCKNKGYVLDGYPRSHLNCQQIFIDENIVVDVSSDGGFPSNNLNKDIIPTVVFQLDSYTDDFIRNRIKTNVDPSLLTTPHYSDEGVIRRLKAYKELNESQKGDPRVIDFFNKYEIDVEVLDCKLNEKDLVDTCKSVIEKVYIYI